VYAGLLMFMILTLPGALGRRDRYGISVVAKEVNRLVLCLLS
jgi:hypothetical protein